MSLFGTNVVSVRCPYCRKTFSGLIGPRQQCPSCGASFPLLKSTSLIASNRRTCQSQASGVGLTAISRFLLVIFGYILSVGGAFLFVAAVSDGGWLLFLVGTTLNLTGSILSYLALANLLSGIEPACRIESLGAKSIALGLCLLACALYISWNAMLASLLETRWHVSIWDCVFVIMSFKALWTVIVGSKKSSNSVESRGSRDCIKVVAGFLGLPFFAIVVVLAVLICGHCGSTSAGPLVLSERTSEHLMGESSTATEGSARHVGAGAPGQSEAWNGFVLGGVELGSIVDNVDDYESSYDGIVDKLKALCELDEGVKLDTILAIPEIAEVLTTVEGSYHKDIELDKDESFDGMSGFVLMRVNAKAFNDKGITKYRIVGVSLETEDVGELNTIPKFNRYTRAIERKFGHLAKFEYKMSKVRPKDFNFGSEEGDKLRNWLVAEMTLDNVTIHVKLTPPISNCISVMIMLNEELAQSDN